MSGMFCKTSTDESFQPVVRVIIGMALYYQSQLLNGFQKTLALVLNKNKVPIQVFVQQINCLYYKRNQLTNLRPKCLLIHRLTNF
jgi:hypothetical protein